MIYTVSLIIIITSMLESTVSNKTPADGVPTNDVYPFIILIISSYDIPQFLQMKELSRMYYKLFSDKIKYFYVELKSDLDKDIVEQGDHIYVKGTESIVPGILFKTAKALDYINQIYTYKYVIRTNLSTFWNLYNLLKVLDYLPRFGLAGGKIEFGSFISGCGIFMSYDVALKVSSLINTNAKMFDDIYLSFLFTHYNLVVRDLHSSNYIVKYLIYDNDNDIPEDISNILYYRIKNSDRNIDVGIFVILLDKIYNINIMDVEKIRGRSESEQHTTKIVDCFTFYNELDLLEYRLEVLYPVIDYFILVEATRTYVGKEKPFYFKNNHDRFSKYLDKIVNIIDDKLVIPNIERGEQWINEIHQRNSIDTGVRILENELSSNDLIIISDLDEIPDPFEISRIRNENIPIIYSSLEQDMYYYNLNTKFLDKWYHAKIVSYGYYKSSGSLPSSIRMGAPYQLISNGGWHLSYFGNTEFIKNKIESFAHQELNRDQYTDLNIIAERIFNGSDLFGRNNSIHQIPINENNYLPYRAIELLSEYILY